MRCTVTWDSASSNKRADLWLKATDPRAITDAADQIDLALTYHPDKGVGAGPFADQPLRLLK